MWSGTSPHWPVSRAHALPSKVVQASASAAGMIAAARTATPVSDGGCMGEASRWDSVRLLTSYRAGQERNRVAIVRGGGYRCQAAWTAHLRHSCRCPRHHVDFAPTQLAMSDDRFRSRIGHILDAPAQIKLDLFDLFAGAHRFPLPLHRQPADDEQRHAK